MSNFIGWFWLEDKFLEQKNEIAVFCSDTEGPWKVGGKLTPGLKFSPGKIVTI